MIYFNLIWFNRFNLIDFSFILFKFWFNLINLSFAFLGHIFRKLKILYDIIFKHFFSSHKTLKPHRCEPLLLLLVESGDGGRRAWGGGGGERIFFLDAIAVSTADSGWWLLGGHGVKAIGSAGGRGGVFTPIAVKNGVYMEFINEFILLIYIMPFYFYYFFLHFKSV